MAFASHTFQIRRRPPVGLGLAPRSHRQALALIALCCATAVALGALVILSPDRFPGFAGAVVALSVTVCLLVADEAVLFCAALLLYPFSGNWQQMGVPGSASPNRILLVAALILAVSRREMYPWRRTAVFWLLVATAALAVTSALAVGTLADRTSFFNLLETFGLLPFCAFLIAPSLFRNDRNRRLLCFSAVILAAYLSMTTAFEMLHFRGLVYPRYIDDPTYGPHFDRGRGPFVEPVTNGVALYASGLLSLLAATYIRSWPRWLAAATGCLAVVCTIFTLQRSVWVGVSVSLILTLLFYREARTWFLRLLPLLVSLAVLAAVSVPGFASSASARVSDQMPIWDRQNLNRAAINMVQARPLFGFGWDTFQTDSANYFQQSAEIPLTATTNVVHNTPLTYAASLGLVGLFLWSAAGGAAFFGGMRRCHKTMNGSRWGIVLFGYTVMYIIVINFVPPAAFPSLMFWTLAGVAFGIQEPADWPRRQIRL